MPQPELTSPDVMARLAVIEAVLGINANAKPMSPGSQRSTTALSTSPVNAGRSEGDQGDPTLSGLWPAIETLESRNRSSNPSAAQSDFSQSILSH
jgi:hypothetical protein